jgi:hypothetical protein
VGCDRHGHMSPARTVLNMAVEPSIDRSLRQDPVLRRAPRDSLSSCHDRRIQGTGTTPRPAAGGRAPRPRHPSRHASVDLLLSRAFGAGLPQGPRTRPCWAPGSASPMPPPTGTSPKASRSFSPRHRTCTTPWAGSPPGAGPNVILDGELLETLWHKGIEARCCGHGMTSRRCGTRSCR